MNVKLSETEKIRVLNCDDVYRIMQRILSRANKIDRNKEHFWTVGLDGSNQILYVELISMGGTVRTIAEPMQVFRVGVLKGAVRMILVHNHPTGKLEPSEGDMETSDRLIQVGYILDIEVIDHLIISSKSYLSFAKEGLMEKLRASKRYVPDYKLKEALKKEVVEEVLKEGEQKEKKAIAIKMKSQGYTIEKIAELTGLSAKSIEEMKP